MPVVVSSGDTDDDDVAFGDWSSDSLVAAGVGSGATNFGHASGRVVRLAGVSNGNFVAGEGSSIDRDHSLGVA